jgi:hypothetical protein
MVLMNEEAKCPVCGRMQSDWRVNNSEGVVKDGQSYCCEGCAESGECSCIKMETAPRLDVDKEDHGPYIKK